MKEIMMTLFYSYTLHYILGLLITHCINHLMEEIMMTLFGQDVVLCINNPKNKHEPIEGRKTPNKNKNISVSSCILK